MYWNDSDKKYLQKIYTRVLRRKTPFLKHHLYINNVETNIKIKHIKKYKGFDSSIILQKDLGYELTNLITLKRSFDTILYQSTIDLVVCDIYWKTLDVLEDVKPNKFVDLHDQVCNIWIFPNNTIKKINLKPGDYLRTVYKP